MNQQNEEESKSIFPCLINLFHLIFYTFGLFINYKESFVINENR